MISGGTIEGLEQIELIVRPSENPEESSSDILVGTVLIVDDSSKAIDSSSGRHHLLELSLVGTVRNMVLLEESNIIEDGTIIKRMT